MNIQEEFYHCWHHVANHSTVKPSDTFRLLDLKLKELERKLALAEGEWETYATSCESLSKKLAEANEMLTSSGIDELQNRLKVAVEALEELKEQNCNCGKCASNDEPYLCIQCEALKKISEGV